jgi:alkylhydroperoxidase family enzyme
VPKSTDLRRKYEHHARPPLPADPRRQADTRAAHGCRLHPLRAAQQAGELVGVEARPDWRAVQHHAAQPRHRHADSEARRRDPLQQRISGKLNELAILVTARHHTANYEWNAHSKLALEGGLNPAIAQAIAEGRRPEGMDADETLIYEFSRSLHENHGVSDELFQRAADRFGERGVVDIIAVNGYYALVSFLLNVDQTPLPPGATPALAPLPK